MGKLMQVDCDGIKVWVETEQELVAEPGPKRVSVSESLTKAVISFQKISDTVKAYCTSLVKAFKDLPEQLRPDKVTAEFGLKVGGEGSVVVVKSAIESSLKVTMEWQTK